MYKKFCLALTNVGVPQLIAFDLVAVSPMSSMYGNVAYIKYVKGTDKGESAQGDLTNSVYELGDVDPRYTSNAVVEVITTVGGISNVSGLAFNQGVSKLWMLGDDSDSDSEADDWIEVAIGDDGALATTIPANTKVKYLYDNIIIPQDKLPTLKAELQNIGLEARARRIAVFYSQMAAFQAKTDYGFDLADGLAEQAVGQLAYEIDTEIV